MSVLFEALIIALVFIGIAASVYMVYLLEFVVYRLLGGKLKYKQWNDKMNRKW